MAPAEACIRRYIDAYNRKDVPGMMACLTPDVVFRNISNGETNMELTGRKAFEQQAKQAAQLFSQREQTLGTLMSFGDFWEADIAYTGTFATGPNAGQTISVQGKSRFLMENDLILQLTDIS